METRFYTKSFSGTKMEEQSQDWLETFNGKVEVVGYAVTGTGDVSYQQTNWDTLYITIKVTYTKN